MKILGIDPGLQRTGFAVLECLADTHHSKSNEFTLVAGGVIQTQAQEKRDFAHRLAEITTSIQSLSKMHQPDVAAIEIVFVNVNPQSTLMLGQARGAALVGLALSDLPVFEYTALQVKKSVVGYGKAAKEQVQMMVQQLLKLSSLPQADMADAMACAICHAHTQRHVLSAVGVENANQAWKNSVSRRVRKGRNLRLTSLDELTQS